jgi:hypothetical protein
LPASVASILVVAFLSVLLTERRAGATSSAIAAVGALPASRAVVARERRMKAVVHAWSARLNAGDNAGVARLFAVPALVAQGPYVYRLRTRAQISEWYSGLPCSGHIVSVAVRGRYATVVFRLGDRGKSPCDAPGTLAAARFGIVNGKIVSWEQIAVPAKKQPAQSGTVA